MGPSFYKIKVTMNALLAVVLIIAGLYSALVLLAFIFQERLIYFPLRSMTLTPAASGLAYKEVRLTTGDGINISAGSSRPSRS